MSDEVRQISTDGYLWTQHSTDGYLGPQFYWRVPWSYEPAAPFTDGYLAKLSKLAKLDKLANLAKLAKLAGEND